MSIRSVSQADFASAVVADLDLNRNRDSDSENSERLDGSKRRRTEPSSNGAATEETKESQVFTQRLSPTTSVRDIKPFSGFVVVEKTLAEKETVFHFLYSQAFSFFELKNYTEAKNYYVGAYIMISNIIDCYTEDENSVLHLENIKQTIHSIICELKKLINEPLLPFNPFSNPGISLAGVFEHITSQNQTEGTEKNNSVKDNSFNAFLKRGKKCLKKNKIGEAEKTFRSALKLEDAKEGPKRILIQMLLAEVNILLADKAFLSNRNERASTLYSNASDYLNGFNSQYLSDDLRSVYNSMQSHIELYSNQLKNPFSFNLNDFDQIGFEQKHPRYRKNDNLLYKMKKLNLSKIIDFSKVSTPEASQAYVAQEVFD